MNMRYILAAFGAIALIIIGIIVLGTLNGPSDSATRNTEDQTVVLTKYAEKNAQVRLTVLGRVVGNEQRNAVRYTVTPNIRTQEILNTYLEISTKRQDYTNTQEGFKTFIHALSNLGFSSEREAKNQDRLGACPFGNIYLYELISEGKGVLSSWSTTCNRRDGTFAGTAGSVRKLFQAQFPEYNKFTSGVVL